MARPGVDAGFRGNLLASSQSAVEDSWRALFVLAVDLSGDLLDDIGAWAVFFVFPCAATPGAHTSHHCQLPRTGIVDLAGCGSTGRKPAIDPNIRDSAGTFRDRDCATAGRGRRRSRCCGD